MELNQYHWTRSTTFLWKSMYYGFNALVLIILHKTALLFIRSWEDYVPVDLQVHACSIARLSNAKSLRIEESQPCPHSNTYHQPSARASSRKYKDPHSTSPLPLPGHTLRHERAR
ncbi:hypothetical protein FRB91_007570 [Serendipita sp. 411]|nr:hypothetical protein FRB91_007570 [Serendipita sp. 411]